jgi:hypothetical protein
MAAGMGIVVTYMQDLLPFPVAALPARNLALLIAMPSVLALVLGACVPHIYRSARRAASARRDEARAAERELALPEAEPEPPPPDAETPRRAAVIRLGRARARAG